MKVTIYQTRGKVEILDMPNEGVMNLIDDWQNGVEPVLSFALNENTPSESPAITHVARAHITRIDVDDETDQGDDE